MTLTRMLKFIIREAFQLKYEEDTFIFLKDKSILKRKIFSFSYIAKKYLQCEGEGTDFLYFNFIKK